MAASTPAEWLPILAKRMDDDMPRVKLLFRYTDGDAPLPEGSKNTRAAWQRFQREARTNWGLLIREAVADRIVPNGITVGGSTESDAAKQAQRIWRDNRMNSVFKDWIRYGLTTRQSFLTTWTGDDGRAIITADSQETMCVSTDPLQPWRVVAGLRVWRDEDAELDFAMVWMDGQRQKFSRPIFDTTKSSKRRLFRRIQDGNWQPFNDEDPIETSGRPPIVVYNNPGGAGEFELHLDGINRINRGLLFRLSIEAMQAYRQRALKSVDGKASLPRKDPEGNDIDYSKIFEPAPGALWELPPGIDLWESDQTDTQWLLAGSKDDIRQLASATRTPLPMMMPDNANQSAAGATSADSGHMAKCADRCAEAKVGGTAALVEALKAENTDLDETVELNFEPVERVSLGEKHAAAAQAKNAGLPWRSIARDVLGWSPEQIRQAAIDMADDRMQDAATRLAQPGARNS